MTQLTRRQLLVSSFACSIALATSTNTFGSQRPKKKAPAKRVTLDPKQSVNTTITVELLAVDGASINTREWSELFQELNVELTIRKALARDQPETTEKLLGMTLRDVHLTGLLERDGSVTFSDRRYTVGDAVKIAEWIKDIQIYGAQGTPKGQPMWGLTKAQFEPVYLALAPLIKTDLVDKPLSDALQLITAQKQYPLRFSASATEHLKRKTTIKTVRNQYQGLSEGTVMSAVLNEFGLGFHPRRTPEGKLELGIVKLGETIETWPAGWPPSEDLVKLRPVLFQSREVELTDEPLLDVVQAIGDIIELPILIDESHLKAKNIDVRTKKVSHKKKKVILSAALKHVCFLGKCKYEYRMDEAGNPLLWLTPEVPPKED
jgi:hypothetical protein